MRCISSVHCSCIATCFLCLLKRINQQITRLLVLLPMFHLAFSERKKKYNTASFLFHTGAPHFHKRLFCTMTSWRSIADIAWHHSTIESWKAWLTSHDVYKGSGVWNDLLWQCESPFGLNSMYDKINLNKTCCRKKT